uniref:RNase H type-1 domain-containing protein n=1 Tax=Oryza sativa subsp. japonica TaxID=39947 RepID=Q6Z9X2_ORYSJ|nr:hypothetical protein [Oryza sativa Japonica Group]
MLANKINGMRQEVQDALDTANYDKLLLQPAYSNKGAVGAICRDTSGKFVAASAMVWEGMSDPTTLEALACNEGLAIAMDCNILKVCIASDCQEVIMGIATIPKCRCLVVLNDINIRSHHFVRAEFRHESWDLNVDAHKLAKFVCTLSEGRHAWLLNPPG